MAILEVIIKLYCLERIEILSKTYNSTLYCFYVSYFYKKDTLNFTKIF